MAHSMQHAYEYEYEYESRDVYSHTGQAVTPRDNIQWARRE